MATAKLPISRSRVTLAALALLGLATAPVQAQVDGTWLQDAVGDYSDPANWAGGNVAGDGGNATIDYNGSVINFGAADNVTLNILNLGVGNLGNKPTFNQNGGTLTVTTFNFGGQGGSRAPTYNLNDGTLNITSAFTWGWGNGNTLSIDGGTLNFSGNNNLVLGTNNGAHAFINLTEGQVNHTGTGSVLFGNGNTRSGSLLIEDGASFTSASTGFISWGHSGNGTGNLTMTGGSFIANAATAIRFGTANSSGTPATGTAILSGNAVFNVNGVNDHVMLGNNGGIGSVTLSDNALFTIDSSDFVIGQFGNGGGTLNMADNATLVAQEVILGGRNAASAVTGVLNMTGGTIVAGSVRQGASGNNTISIDGGTIRVAAHANNNQFLNGLPVTLGAGGLTFDTDGNDSAANVGGVTGSGGITKIGSGVLTLYNSGSYTGATTISEGTLRLNNSDVLHDDSTLVLAGGTLDVRGAFDHIGSLDLATATASMLQFGQAGDSVAQVLRFGGIGAGDGTLSVTNWDPGFDQFLFDHEADALAIAAVTSFIDPTGFAPGVYESMVIVSGEWYEVVAVPEPACLALMGLGGLMLLHRRRQAV